MNAKRLTATAAMALFLMTSLMFALPTVAQEADTTAQVEQAESGPSLIAVKMHADWCAACRKMAPAVDELAQSLDQDTSVLLVTVDLTDDATSRQGKLLMNALGLGDVFERHGNKTGLLLLVAPDTGEVVGVLTSDMTAAEMKEAVDATS